MVVIEKRKIVRRRLKSVENKLDKLEIALRNTEEQCESNPQDYQRLLRVYDSRIEKLKERQRIYDGFLS